MGTSHSAGNNDHGPRTANWTSEEAAKEMVSKYKQKCGSGVSTRLIIRNNSDKELRYGTGENNCGKFFSDPPDSIGAGDVGIFLHTKRDSSSYGSSGFCYYEFDSMYEGRVKNARLYVAWETPFSGHNKFGTAIFPFGESCSNPMELRNSATQYHKCETIEMDPYWVEGKLVHGGSSPTILYTIHGTAPATDDDNNTAS
eukprot:Hpha_TRINITY_DN14860_c2_g5::TRINITY_DN14860_c2_g5_i1::g.169431::m.169431